AAERLLERLAPDLELLLLQRELLDDRRLLAAAALALETHDGARGAFRLRRRRGGLARRELIAQAGEIAEAFLLVAHAAKRRTVASASSMCLPIRICDSHEWRIVPPFSTTNVTRPCTRPPKLRGTPNALRAAAPGSERSRNGSRWWWANFSCDSV